MKYSSIFKEIITIIENDYAGAIDKKSWANAEDYLQEIIALESNYELTDEIFDSIVTRYLLNFDDNHLNFITKNTQTYETLYCGFSVKRWNDSLYISNTIDETALPLGTEIIAIDGTSINELSDKNSDVLRDTISERQRWSAVLNKATNIEYKTADGTIEQFYLNAYPYQYKPDFKAETINDDIIYLKISNLTSVEQVQSIVDSAIDMFQQKQKCIVDLRGNPGGNSHLLNPLEPYFFLSNEKPSTTIKERLFNCTNENVDRFLHFIQQTRSQVDNKEMHDMLDLAETQLKANKGKGFVSLDFSNYIETLTSNFKGNDQLDQIIILMDNNTASASEEFIQVVNQSSKVKTLGRATAGINDYSDVLPVTWKDTYTLCYPISKVKELTDVHPLHGKGIQPDVYIPWTPEHTQRDVDLEEAISLIKRAVARS